MSMQSLTRSQMRQSIGYNLQDMVLVTASTTGDTSSLIATYSLAKGGDDEYNGRQVYAVTPAGSIVAAEKSWVSDFDSTNKDATVSPVFTAAIMGGDVFELWNVFTVEEINDEINQAIDHITSKALQVKEIHTPFTESGKYFYNCLSGFTHVHLVEYVTAIGTEEVIHRCDEAWDELADPTGVTSSLDTSFYKEGGGSVKLVMTASATTGLLKTMDITSLDISACTEAQIWVYSTTALDAGDLQLILDDTAECASATESLDIPATTANTWTRHIITLANPQSDSAIISVGINQVVDKAAFNLWVDDIKAIDALTNLYEPLPIEYWSISQGSTPYLLLTSKGLGLVGENTQMKVNGFQIASRLSADSSTSEIDPSYIIARVTGRLLISHAKSSLLDIHDRKSLSAYWLGEADKIARKITTTLPGTVREVL